MEETMKKAQRILAAVGIILLIGLYLSTLVFALLGKDFFPMFIASLFSSFALPVLIWAYGFIYKLIKKNHSLDIEGSQPKSKGDSPS